MDSCFENFQYRMAMGWGFAAELYLGNAQGAEFLLSLKSLEWWLDAVQGWYTLAPVREREKWQADFQAVMDQTEVQKERKRQKESGVCLRNDGWVGEPATYGRLWQIYGVLTMPEPGQEEKTSGQEQKEEMLQQPEGVTGEDTASSQEMEVLSTQLKEKVRFLIQQGETQAALGVIGQLKIFFPGDVELLELQTQCGGE